MDRSRLNIGTYILQPYARSEAHICDLKDCGIDFVVCMENDRKALDLFSKYGLGAVVTGVLPGWWGGDGENAGKLEETNPLKAYLDSAARFEDHPAVWGIDVGDEPSALDFPYYGKVIDTVNRVFPNQFAYLNLYPNYAVRAANSGEQTVNQLGTTTYDEHIDCYCRNVGTDYICYDFYLYSVNVSKAYENLITVADACLKTGRSMWIVLQVNNHVPDKYITANELRFQAYTAMAFGAENIIWACYTAGWWYNQVLDENGNKTQQYDKLKMVNAEIRALAGEYMKYRRVGTYFVGFEGTQWLSGTDIMSDNRLDLGYIKDIRSDHPVVVGDFTSRSTGNGRALFVCAADAPYDEKSTVTQLHFTCGCAVRAYSGKGIAEVNKTEDGGYCVVIRSNEGILIEVSDE